MPSKMVLLRHSLVISLVYLLEFLVPEANSQQGTCVLVGGEDVGPANADGTCSTPGATAYFQRCCLEETTSTSSTTTATSCEQMGMVDIGPSIGDACDGDAVAYSGRCCIESTTTTSSNSTSTSTTTTSTTPTTTPTTTTSTTTSSTSSTSTTTATTPSSSTPPSLYRNGKFVMKCVDVDPTPSCLPKILSCLSDKVKMAYTCCGSCYAVFPTFLPKMKNCVDDFPEACAFWGKDRCSKSTTFGQIMADHCKKLCDNCPK